MIIEVNGKQVEVDDSFATLSPEKQQIELRFITQSMEPKGSVEVRGANPEDLINPLYATIGGAIAGEVAGPMINKGAAAVSTAPGAAPGGVNPASAGQKWAAKTGFGAGPGQTVEEVSSAFKAQSKPIGSGKISGKIPSNSPMNVDKMLQLDAAKQAEEARRAAALRQAAPFTSKLPAPLQKTAQFIGGATQSGVAPWLGRGVAGAGTGFQAADAYNRLQQGDLPGAAISGLGALGSAASFIPTPMTRVGGAAIGIGTAALNAYLDKLKGEAENAFKPAGPAQQQPPQGGMPEQPSPLNATMPQMAAGGLVHLSKGRLVKKLSEVLVPREGQTLIGTMADRTKATEGFSGGPGFINLHPEYTWAMDAPGAASRLLNVVNAAGGPERTVVAPMLMSKTAHKSNRPVFEKIYKELQEDIRSGKVTPEQVAALNKRLAAEKGLEASPGIDSKDFLEFANAFHRRGSVADIFGKKRIGAVDLQRHLDETIDPALREAELGAIGPQLFTAESQLLKPDVHPGYKYVITGEKGADQFTPVPREFLFRDLESKAMKELGRPLSDYNYRTSVGVPSQLIDEKLIRSLEELGYKKGGLV